MEEKKKIPWFPILSTVFSGIGIKIIDLILDMLQKKETVSNITEYKNIFMVIVCFIVLGVCILINYMYCKKTYEKKVVELAMQYENSLFEIQSAREEVEGLLTMTQYANRKYEELDEFYKKISSVIYVDGDISDSLIIRYIDKLERIIADNTSVEYEKINITIFEKKRNAKDTYVISLSNYHTAGTIKNLELGKKSFVGSIFRNKKVDYIPNISNRNNGVPFVEREGRNYETICGVPYVVDDECIAVVVITMRESDSLNEIVSSYMKLVERYVQVIGFLLMFRDNKED